MLFVLYRQLARRLGLRYHSDGAVRAATDKLTQRQRLRDAGLRVPRFQVLERPEQVVAVLADVGTPAVLKPVRGAGSRHVFRVDGPDDALRYASDAFATVAGQLVLEEMLIGCPDVAGPGLGDYVSAELLLWRGTVAYQVVNGCLPLVEPFRERGFLIPARLSAAYAAEICRVSAAACRALGLCDGWVDIELKLTADGPVVIEVNGRLGGYVAALLYRSFGVEAVRLAFEVAVGRQPVIPACEPTAVAFEYQILPPVGDWRLASWGHIADLAERPEILSVVLHAAPGTGLTGGWAAWARSVSFRARPTGPCAGRGAACPTPAAPGQDPWRRDGFMSPIGATGSRPRDVREWPQDAPSQH